MEKILKNQEEEIAFQWKGDIENADIKKAVELKIAFIMRGMSDDTTLWVKTGEYEAATKETIARVKYQNVPIDYWVVISDCIEKDNEIKHVKKVKIIKDKKFSSKYRILDNEPTLFDNEENKTEEEKKEIKNLKGELKETVRNFSDKTGIKVEVC